MTVAISFALIGGVILVGFLAHLLFRVTRIPSVVLLMAIGVILGPVTGWITSDALITVAPFFGTMALLIILFEGGLQLDIVTVLRQAPRAAVLAVLGFVFSMASVAALAHYAAGISVLNSLLLAGILGASSPAICIPVASGLSVRDEIKTILKLESALGDVLLLGTVLLMLDAHGSGNQGAWGMVSGFVISIAVAFVIALIAGVLWSRLIGWMGKEPLAYMLTLGFVFLLYFAVEELRGSAAIAVLMFGLLLENMQAIAGRLSVRVRDLFGIDIRAEQFVLHQFMKNITEELSFLIRTFFFVYLGLLLDFGTLNLQVGLAGAGMVVLLLVSRWLALQFFKRKGGFSAGELQVVMSLLPRGLTTAVMAFLPAQYGIAGVALFPTYAFVVIVLTNVFMTAGVVFAERRLDRERAAAGPSEPAKVLEQEVVPQTAMTDALSEAREPPQAAASESAFFLPDIAPAGRAAPASFAEWTARILGIRLEERKWCYAEAIRASSLAEPPFWVQTVLATALTALGLVLNQSAIVIGAALIVPLLWPVLGAGLALAAGDIYLLLKLLVKIGLAAVAAILLSALFSELLPFNAVTAEIASRTRPTILDFLVALFAGMSGAGLASARRRRLQYLPGALVAVTLLPPLTVLGLGVGRGFGAEISRGGALLFSANFFAVILGAAMVFSAVGMPRIADLAFVDGWKQRELGRPVVNLIFERLGLKHIIGRAGSVRARLVVTFVFLLALVIPLQMAFNQLSQEFRARQAITEVEKMFDVAGRSAIVNSSCYLHEDRIDVRIQVATNAFFTADDIRHFEERVADRTGRTTQLNLVQSISDVGEGTKVRELLAPRAAEPARAVTVGELVGDLRNAFESHLRAVSIPGTMTLLSAGAELSRGQASPFFRLVFLADAPMAEDTRGLLTRWLERQMSLAEGSVRLDTVASTYRFELDPRGGLRETDRARLSGIGAVLMRYPQLRVQVDLPARGGERVVKSLRLQLAVSIPQVEDAARCAIQEDPEAAGSLTISLRPASPRAP